MLNNPIVAGMCLMILCAQQVIVHAQDDALDFTTGNFETIGAIKAKADKPQVSIVPSRIAPEFKQFELEERSFINDVLKSAQNQELNKKIDKKVFKIEKISDK